MGATHVRTHAQGGGNNTHKSKVRTGARGSERQCAAPAGGLCCHNMRRMARLQWAVAAALLLLLLPLLVVVVVPSAHGGGGRSKSKSGKGMKGGLLGVPHSASGERPQLFVLSAHNAGASAVAAALGELTGLRYKLHLSGEHCPEEDEPIAQVVASEQLPLQELLTRNAPCFYGYDILQEPQLALVAEQLPTLFPEARFLFVVRAPEHNVRSVLDMLQLDGLGSAVGPGNRPPTRREELHLKERLEVQLLMMQASLAAKGGGGAAGAVRDGDCDGAIVAGGAGTQTGQ